MDLMNTINGEQLVYCFTQCSASVSCYILRYDSLIPLKPPEKIHSRRPVLTRHYQLGGSLRVSERLRFELLM